MRVKVEQVGNGLHPSEVVVSVRTNEGAERLVVDRRSLSSNNSLEVGYPIDSRDNLFLVELPRETTTGSWRVWVHESETVREPVAA